MKVCSSLRPLKTQCSPYSVRSHKHPAHQTLTDEENIQALHNVGTTGSSDMNNSDTHSLCTTPAQQPSVDRENSQAVDSLGSRCGTSTGINNSNSYNLRKVTGRGAAIREAGAELNSCTNNCDSHNLQRVTRWGAVVREAGAEVHIYNTDLHSFSTSTAQQSSEVGGNVQATDSPQSNDNNSLDTHNQHRVTRQGAAVRGAGAEVRNSIKISDTQNLHQVTRRGAAVRDAIIEAACIQPTSDSGCESGQVVCGPTTPTVGATDTLPTRSHTTRAVTQITRTGQTTRTTPSKTTRRGTGQTTRTAGKTTRRKTRQITVSGQTTGRTTGQTARSTTSQTITTHGQNTTRRADQAVALSQSVEGRASQGRTLGQITRTSGQAARTNRITRTSSQAARTSGRITRTSSQAARTSNRITRTSSQAARTSGQITSTSTQAARTSGRITRASSQAARTSGQITRTSSQVARTSGQEARTSGQITRTSGQAARTSGQITRTSGRTTRTSSQEERISGRITRTSSRVARTSGRITRTSGQAARTPSRGTRTIGQGRNRATGRRNRMGGRLTSPYDGVHNRAVRQLMIRMAKWVRYWIIGPEMEDGLRLEFGEVGSDRIGSDGGGGSDMLTQDKVLASHTCPVHSPPDEICSICISSLRQPTDFWEDEEEQESEASQQPIAVEFTLCHHVFHRACVRQLMKHCRHYLQCPYCKTIHGVKTGNQPTTGDMFVWRSDYKLPGHSDCGTYIIEYSFRSGVQGPEHPNPGQPYTAHAFPRVAFLPASDKGTKILRMLREAWQRRLIFTVGTSATTGLENVITWADIHHKTNMRSNYDGHGYPDPEYLDNVKGELWAVGVTEESMGME